MQMSIQANGQQSQNNCWETPQWLAEVLAYRLTKRTYFDLDAAASPQNTKAAKFFTEEDDGLTKPWFGSVFLNPPWGRFERACKPVCIKRNCVKRGFHIHKDTPGIGAWERKAWEEGTNNPDVRQVVNIAPTNNTDSSWFHAYGLRASTIVFLGGRVPFEIDGIPHRNNAVACSVFLFDNKPKRYPEVYGWALKDLRKQYERLRR